MKRKLLIALLLCAAVCLAGCGFREENPADSTGAGDSWLSQNSPGAASGFDQTAYDDAVAAILDQYMELRENGIENFDEDAHQQLPWYSAVVASWTWNGLYWGTYDFDGNGIPELIVAAGTDEYCQPVGIYAFNGQEMLYLCPDQALGERSCVSFVDDLFFVQGSGSAYTGSITVYRIAPDGYSTEIIEEMSYEYLDSENVVYTPEIGNMTAEELLSHDYLKGFDLPVMYTRFADSYDGGAAPGAPNPWTAAASAEEAAQGAVLDSFVPPEVISCAAFLPEHCAFSYMDGVAEAMYDNGLDCLVIRKGQGSTDVSGDYNDYPETKELELKGLTIRCSGADGQIRLVRWEFDGNSYSLSFNAGDMSRPGLTEDQVASLVEQIG